jgi:hypothetical protein
MPPLTCPPPQEQEPDCPLFAQRVIHYSFDENLRRAILTEHRSTPDLAALIRAERHRTDPVQAALPPGATPGAASIFNQLEEEANAKPTCASD